MRSLPHLVVSLLLVSAIAGCLEEGELPPGDDGTPVDEGAGARCLPDAPGCDDTPGPEEEPPTGSSGNMCIEGAEDCDDAVGAEVVDVERRTLAQGQQSAISQSVRRVFDTEQAWGDFWAQHAANEIPTPSTPEVDFATERVVAVILSEKPNGCYATAITNVTRSGDEILVEVTTYTPEPSRGCTQVITQPFHFVAIAAEETDVAFVERSQQGAPGA